MHLLRPPSGVGGSAGPRPDYTPFDGEVNLGRPTSSPLWTVSSAAIGRHGRASWRALATAFLGGPQAAGSLQRSTANVIAAASDEVAAGDCHRLPATRHVGAWR